VPPELEPEEHAPEDDEEKAVEEDDWGEEGQENSALRPEKRAPSIDEDKGDAEVQGIWSSSTEEPDDGYTTVEVDEGDLEANLYADEIPLKKRHKNDKSASKRGKDEAKKKPRSKKVISPPNASSEDEQPPVQTWKKWGDVDESQILVQTPSRRKNRGRRKHSGHDGFYIRPGRSESD
jgi:hypothetical protein